MALPMFPIITTGLWDQSEDCSQQEVLIDFQSNFIEGLFQ